MGRNKEALKLVSRAWDLIPGYDHTVFLHLQEVEKAVANQKNI
jgi:hypothetical protein